MKIYILILSVLFLASCEYQSNQFNSEKIDTSKSAQEQSSDSWTIWTKTIFTIPENYTKYFENKKTGINFYYPASIYLTEANESWWWDISSTGAKQNEEWIHTLTLTWTTDKSKLYFALPDHTSPNWWAPHVWISENQENFKGHTLTKKLAWVTQDGTWTTDEWSWEVTYSNWDKYIQLIEYDMQYGSGYTNTISQSTEEIAKNILVQLIGK